MSRPADPLLPLLGVQPQGVEVSFDGFFRVETHHLTHDRHDGGRTPPLRREVFVMGDAVVVLPWDPARDVVLLLDQFRMAPFVRGAAQPWVLETIAGRVDKGETPQQAAIREAEEEAGLRLDPARLVAGPAAYPSPGAVSEYIHTFIALHDLPEGSAGLGGLAAEAEDIRTHLVPRAELTARALAGRLENAPLALIALWLELMAPRLLAGAGAVAGPVGDG